MSRRQEGGEPEIPPEDIMSKKPVMTPPEAWHLVGMKSNEAFGIVSQARRIELAEHLKDTTSSEISPDVKAAMIQYALFAVFKCGLVTIERGDIERMYEAFQKVDRQAARVGLLETAAEFYAKTSGPHNFPDSPQTCSSDLERMFNMKDISIQEMEFESLKQSIIIRVASELVNWELAQAWIKKFGFENHMVTIAPQIKERLIALLELAESSRRKYNMVSTDSENDREQQAYLIIRAMDDLTKS